MEQRGAGHLHLDQHVRHAVLKSLKIADGRAELLADLEIVTRGPERSVHDAQRFAANGNGGMINGQRDRTFCLSALHEQFG